MAAEEGITDVGQSLETITSPSKREPFEGAEKEPAPLTPEKLDIVDKDTMDVRLRAIESKADGNQFCTSPPEPSIPDSLSLGVSEAIPSGMHNVLLRF